MLTNPFSWLFGTRKININSADSTRNLAIAIGEVAAGRSYDLTANPAGSFRALNLDPQVRILTGAPAITQPLYGANLKIELNGTVSTGNKTGGVFAINAYALITGAGHTVDKNVGMSVLADVGASLTGTTVTENTSLEVVGIATKGTTTITNARSLNVTCPNHGANRRGILIAAEQITGVPVGTSNRSFENLGTSNLVGAVTIGSTLTVGNAITTTAGISATTGIFSGFMLAAPTFRFTTLASAPATATSIGNQGDCVIDANFLYVCTATNTWKRTALSTW